MVTHTHTHTRARRKAASVALYKKAATWAMRSVVLRVPGSGLGKFDPALSSGCVLPGSALISG